MGRRRNVRREQNALPAPRARVRRARGVPAHRPQHLQVQRRHQNTAGQVK